MIEILAPPSVIREPDSVLIGDGDPQRAMIAARLANLGRGVCGAVATCAPPGRRLLQAKVAFYKSSVEPAESGREGR